MRYQRAGHEVAPRPNEHADGVEVVQLRDVLEWCSRDDLVGLACECLSYELADDSGNEQLSVREEMVCVGGKQIGSEKEIRERGERC